MFVSRSICISSRSLYFRARFCFIKLLNQQELMAISRSSGYIYIFHIPKDQDGAAVS